ncbi:MAG: amidohydrolase, partial [Proteobacteria bacterium]|nr:amidohydrolase [Pseudomonadota bacterium]
MLCGAARAQESVLLSQARKATQDIEAQLIDWRQYFHANPELSNREFGTAEKIAAHLRALGLDVETGVAHTGVVALVRGRNLHPMVALRADIDALPVTEPAGLPFASQVTTTFNNQQTGVMHACGHDTHIAILMAAAEVLASMRDRLSGSVLLIFQPAEEGPPEGEKGGARLMLDEGLFERYPVDVAFGLHTWSALNAGVIVVVHSGHHCLHVPMVVITAPFDDPNLAHLVDSGNTETLPPSIGGPRGRQQRGRAREGVQAAHGELA